MIFLVRMTEPVRLAIILAEGVGVWLLRIATLLGSMMLAQAERIFLERRGWMFFVRIGAQLLLIVRQATPATFQQITIELRGHVLIAR